MKISHITSSTLFLGVCLLASCKTEVSKRPVTAQPAAPAKSPVTAPGQEGETRLTAMSPIPVLRAASERGDALGEAILGYLLVHGLHVPQNVEEGLQLLQRSADQGFAHAMAELGNLYLNGKLVPQDYEKALHWLKLGADKDEAGAERDLGVCYQKGYGVETNFSTAAVWYRRATGQTNYVAMKDLGALYMDGTGVAKDDDMAIHWLTLAAEKGHIARAMYDLGVLGENGRLGENSLRKAIGWYQDGADLDDSLACWRLAICYNYGKGVPKDFAKYFYLAGKAANQGVAEAQFFVGEAYRLGKDVPPSRELAMSWYRGAATNNYPDACYNLAVEYLEDKTNEASRVEAGRYMLQAAQLEHRQAQTLYALASLQGTFAPKNLTQWKEWLKRAAKGGWPKAEFMMSQALMSPWAPFAKDETEGEKWLEQAAAHGDFEAQCKLAIRLMQGIDVAKNPSQAVKWWRWAAEHGYPQAQNDLGYAIETGDSEKADLVEACMWFQLAAKGGIDPARVNLKNISGSLTAEQLDEATRRSANFQPQPLPTLNPIRRDGDIGTPSLNMSGD
jgi:TPR repeat protein